MSPGTEFARDFCAGIGPLQLGVVLVYNLFTLLYLVFRICFLNIDKKNGKHNGKLQPTAPGTKHR